MLRGLGAVVLAYAVMAVIVMAGSIALLASVVPGGLAAMKELRGRPEAMPTPTPRYYTLNLLLSLVAALVGGWLVARLTHDPTCVLILAGVTLVIGALTAFFGPGQNRQPGWYRVVITLVGVGGVLLGARLVGV